MGKYYAGPEEAPAPPGTDDPEYDAALFGYFAACIKRFGPIPAGAVIEIHALKPDMFGAPLLMVHFSIPGGK